MPVRTRGLAMGGRRMALLEHLLERVLKGQAGGWWLRTAQNEYSMHPTTRIVACWINPHGCACAWHVAL